jgi:hypothetical protein
MKTSQTTKLVRKFWIFTKPYRISNRYASINIVSRIYFLVLYKLFFASLVILAIIAQLISVSGKANFDTVNFFSYFTIESNVFASLIFLISALMMLSGRKIKKFDVWRGAAATYMTITGVVYTLLLSGINVQVTLPWVNLVVHYIFPVVVFADWFIDRPSLYISYRQAFNWLIFPIIYLAYSLIRGSVVSWYPYPFLNPGNGGYGKVFLVSLGISAFAAILCLLLAKVTPKTGKN